MTEISPMICANKIIYTERAWEAWTVVTSGSENARIELTVTLRKTLHHAIDLLRFARQTKAPQELPTCQAIATDEWQIFYTKYYNKQHMSLSSA